MSGNEEDRYSEAVDRGEVRALAAGRYLFRCVLAVVAFLSLFSPSTIALYPVLVLAIMLSFPRVRHDFFESLLSPLGRASDRRLESGLLLAIFGALLVAVATWGGVVTVIPQGERENGHWFLIPASFVLSVIGFVRMAWTRSR